MLHLDYRYNNDVILKVSATSSHTTDWMTIGPIQLLSPSPERKSFCWTASVDPNKKIAFSRETSNVVNDRFTNYKYDRHDDRFWNESVMRIFESYPKWMCQGSVTLGLLQAIPQSKQSIGCSYEIRTRWGGINLLTFDRPHRKRRFTRDTLMRSSVERFDTVTLPMLGGLMSGRRTQGSLKFTLRTKVGEKTPQQQQQQRRRFIVTEIDSYRPRLLGEGDRGVWRARVYLHTQSVIHAYVMWRFHNHIFDEYCEGK